MSKPKSPKMAQLLAKVMGTEPATEGEALAAALAKPEDDETAALLAQVEHTVTSVNNVMAPQNTLPVTLNVSYSQCAYDITYKEDTKEYILHTIEYTPNGGAQYMKSEVLSKYLAEASHKLNRMMMDKLIGTFAPNFKVKK